MEGLGGSTRRPRAPAHALAAVSALATAALVLVAALLAPSPAGAAASSPFVLAPDTGLYDQFGYAPAYTRNVPAFDASGRAYMRSRTSSGAETSYVHTLEGDAWVRLDFLAALRAAYPTFVRTVGAAGLRSDGVVFDRQDRAYNPLTIELRDGSTRNCLLVSLDHCRTWTVFKLPAGTFTIERPSGPGALEGPPFLALWRESAAPDLPGSQTNTLYVTQPRLEDDQLVLPPLVRVTDRCLGLSRDSGGAAFAVTRGATTWFVWSEVAPKGKGGTPHFVSTYDHATGSIGRRTRLATSPERSDPHDKPGICLDGAGTLHVVCGSHGTPALYTRSNLPLTADAGWTAPVPVLGTGWVSAADPALQDGRQTYPAFVCDGGGTLHLITRQWRRGVDPYHEGRGYAALVHQSCPPGGVWSEPTVIVAGAYAGYGVFFHKLALDARDRLFLSCSYQGGPELDGERVAGVVRALLGRSQLSSGKYRGRMLLVSEDAGASWRFAADADLAPPGEAVAAAPRAAAARAAAGPPAPPYAWRWLNPLPQGNQLTSVSFSRGSGWAVGTHGTIASSTDGGATWTAQAAPTTDDLYCVAAAAPRRAWAVGPDGLILRTGDGGATWAVVPSGTTLDLLGVSAVSAREGWAVGERGAMLHTTDGGVTWILRERPTSETLVGIDFSDRVHGLTCGRRGILLRTRDGGRHWKRRRSLTNSQLLSVAVLRDGRAAACGGDGDLILSTDGGWTWAKARTGTGETLRAVRLLPRGRVWALGPRTVLRSSDGGRHWRRARIPVPGPCGALALPGGTRVIAGGSGGALCRSEDGGRRWRVLGQGVRDDLLAAAASDGGRVVLAGAGGRTLTTADGGATWSAAVVAGGRDLRALAARGDVTWAAGDGGAVARRDPSGAWTALPSPTAEDLRAVAAPSEQSLVVAGDAGALLTSSDGGQSWTARRPTEDDLFALSFARERAGWAGGGAGFGETRAEVVHTVDGGASWTRLDLPVWGRVRGLSFTGALTGWAAVEDWGIDGDRPQGSILMTADGGATWVRQAGTQRVLTGVAVAGDGSGWAWGEGGTVLRTGDGGASWLPVDAGTHAAVTAGLLLPSGEVWLAGEGGAVIAGALAAAPVGAPAAAPAAVPAPAGRLVPSPVSPPSPAR